MYIEASYFRLQLFSLSHKHESDRFVYIYSNEEVRIILPIYIDDHTCFEIASCILTNMSNSSLNASNVATLVPLVSCLVLPLKGTVLRAH